MSNTLSASLILDTLSKRTQTTIGNQFAPWSAFASDFSDEPLNQGQSVQVPLATAGGTTQTNPTNWESGDSTLANVPVTVNGYSQSFHITPLQMNNSFKLAQLMDINVQNFVNKINDVACAPFNSTHWTNFIQAASGFVSANLQTIWAGISRSPMKNIILDGTYYAKFLPASLTTEIGPRAGLSGFDGVFLNTRWTGAGTNVLGFAGGPQSVAYVSGIPTYDDETKADINAEVMSIDIAPGKTLPVLMSTWLSRATRTRWASLDVMFGAAKLDNTQGYLIKSGGTA